MSQLELLKKTTNFLVNSRIEYMLTGSIVSSLQGEPRSTNDIDIIISIKENEINKLLDFYKMPEYYIDEESIKNAIRNDGMFNLIDLNSSDKIDFWLLTKNDFDKSRFQRKYIENFMGIEIYVSSFEDTILAKLNWSKLSGGSKKQIIDALRIYELQEKFIDFNYLNFWIEKLGLFEEWKKLLDLKI
jgi:hypothetical protein